VSLSPLQLLVLLPPTRLEVIGFHTVRQSGSGLEEDGRQLGRELGRDYLDEDDGREIRPQEEEDGLPVEHWSSVQKRT
jgi:hypothetical protein